MISTTFCSKHPNVIPQKLSRNWNRLSICSLQDQTFCETLVAVVQNLLQFQNAIISEVHMDLVVIY